jgi:hypothetical protein
MEVKLTSLIRLRGAVHCSREKTAEEAGLSPFKLWLIESGRIAPTRSEEIQIRQALHRILKKRSREFQALLQQTTQQL